MTDQDCPLPTIKIVGISASGKSTLSGRLRTLGYNAHPVSQEHSNIPNLWELFGMPDALVCLLLEFEEQSRRRPDVSWQRSTHWQERLRLLHAYSHADVRIDTSHIDIDTIVQIALLMLERKHITRSPNPLPPLTQTGIFREVQPQTVN